MEDIAIVELFWERAEDAISQAQLKYGTYCRSVAFSILRSAEDSEECENDTFLHAWNAMPPSRPTVLSSFLAKITRNLSLDRLRQKNAQKRLGEYSVVLEEVEAYLFSPGSPDENIDAETLAVFIQDYLKTVPKKSRLLFVGRYWNLLSVEELAAKFSLTESAVRTSLHRTRSGLAKYLKKEGYDI